MTTSPIELDGAPITWHSPDDDLLSIHVHVAETFARLEAMNRGRRRAVLPPTPRQLARDITNGVVEEHLGPRPARHRRDS